MTYDGHASHDPGRAPRGQRRSGAAFAVGALVVALVLYLFPEQIGALLGIEGSEESVVEFVQRIAVGAAALGVVAAIVNAISSTRRARAEGRPQREEW